jgi:hypothetical protein
MSCRAVIRPFSTLRDDVAAIMADFLAALEIQLDWLAFVTQSPCNLTLHDAMNGRYGGAALQLRAAP